VLYQKDGIKFVFESRPQPSGPQTGIY